MRQWGVCRLKGEKEISGKGQGPSGPMNMDDVAADGGVDGDGDDGAKARAKAAAKAGGKAPGKKK